MTPAEQVPEDVEHFESLEGRLEIRVVPRSAETVALNLYSVRALGLTDILRTLQNLGLTVTEELRIPIALPEGRKCFLYRFELEAPQWRIAALHLGKDRFIDALRALDEERATDDPLNSLILLASLTWRDTEVLRTLRNHLLQVRTPLQRGDRERRPHPERARDGRPLQGVRRALRPRGLGRPGGGRHRGRQRA